MGVGRLVWSILGMENGRRARTAVCPLDPSIEVKDESSRVAEHVHWFDKDSERDSSSQSASEDVSGAETVVVLHENAGVGVKEGGGDWTSRLVSDSPVGGGQGRTEAYTVTEKDASWGLDPWVDIKSKKGRSKGNTNWKLFR